MTARADIHRLFESGRTSHRLDEYLDAHHAERDTEIVRWLSKKAREYRATGRKTDRERADFITVLASKISRGAVRPNNTRLPAGVLARFFEPGCTYQRRRWLFECLSVAPDPFTGETRAVGFLHRPGEPATATAMNADNWADEGWTDATEAGGGVGVTARDVLETNIDPAVPADMASASIDDFRAEVRAEAAADVHRAELPKFPAGETPENVAKVVRAVDVRLAERGPEAPYGVAEDTTPDFFQPGHSYTHRNGSTFRCVADTTHPDSGWRVALGWITDTAGYTFADFKNIHHWNYEYDGVQPAAEAGERQ